MRLSKFDALTYALMVGLGEAYFIADGVRLGATTTEIALLVGLPLAVGACGPILALRLLRKLGRRKPVVIGAAAVQVALLFLLAWLDASGAATARLLIAVSTAYQICAQCAGTAWSSWYGDLVPTLQRGRYFAARNRMAYIGTLVGIVAGGLLLGRFEQARAGIASAMGGNGFAIAYLLAGVFRCLSVGLLAASSEGRFLGMPDLARVGRFLRTERGSDAWRLILLVGLLQVAVYIASPFFNPYMLEELEFSYVEYMVASAFLVAIKALVLPLWGRAIDRGGVQRVLALGGLGLALVPLPWILVRDLWGVVLCQSISGAAWAGFEVGHFSLLLQLGYKRMRPTVFAAQALVSGSAQLAGGLMGSFLLSAESGARVVFAVSSGLRIGVVLLLIRFLAGRTSATRQTRPQFRIAGFRAGTGVVHRPIEESDARSVPPSDEHAQAGPL